MLNFDCKNLSKCLIRIIFPPTVVSEYYEYGHGNNDEAYNNYGKQSDLQFF